MNTGIFTGNIGRDAELRNTSTGDPVANFSLAVQTGTKAAPETMWVDCQMWGDRGAKLTPYLLKGTKITAMGRVKLREYVKQDGTAGASIQLACNEIELHGRKEDGQSAAPAEPTAQRSVASRKKEIDEDDIPF